MIQAHTMSLSGRRGVAAGVTERREPDGLLIGDSGLQLSYDF